MQIKGAPAHSGRANGPKDFWTSSIVRTFMRRQGQQDGSYDEYFKVGKNEEMHIREIIKEK